MGHREEVLAAARDRARALAEGDAAQLEQLLHEQFRWTTHLGEVFGRREYIRRNTGGDLVWHAQDLDRVDVVVVDDMAVLLTEVTDEVTSPGRKRPETFRMPLTQVWIRADGRWRCLAGHAGPRRD